ncbi:prion-inhibition and propagation-domain-containing protein [Annulohypoxylon maeteangense]|uniref:prion-inhibition and propagation-domain-containing protein n=1 Tax=Annulohypoxylon maeteangense TaxID=1927788 RepID=UPI0020084345|nr:prion-inhibition and propagation-domain-containing protein [Annulohypoxylon maeteangense]KAI0886548.1 prion-inhibition and propagation-domain-containing protein [Annulohypoxylon maeteangense]
MADPLSITASTAGLISLSLQLFGGCIKGFVLLSTAQNLGKHASAIECILNIQEIQLTDWARRAGLLTGDGILDPRLNSNAVEMILQRLQDLLLDTEKLKKRYGLKLVPIVDAEHQTTAQLHNYSISEVDRVFTGISDDSRRQILARAKVAQGQHIFKRLWWAAVDKDNIEKLAADVHFLVRELWNLLDPTRQDDFLNSTKDIVSNMVSLNTKFDQLFSLSEALKTLQAESQSMKALAASAEIKALRICLDGSEQAPTQQDTSTPKRRKLLEKLEPLSSKKLTNFKPLKKNEFMGLADYDGEVMLVEKKSITNLPWSKILPRVENLAALLNAPKDETFRSLLCKGIVMEDNTISFVFHHPTPDNPIEPRSLLDLFSARDGIEPPSLTDRVQLTLSIAHLVQNFHRSGWLHKSLRSQNILFFPKADGSISLDEPFLAGFAFARVGSPSEISEQPSANPKFDIYRHPHALGDPTTSFSATMDVYSLGTVMLEIAEWRALQYLVDGVVNVSAENVPLTQLAKVKPFLLDEGKKSGTSKLRYRTGNIYAAACMMCLKGEINEAEADKGNVALYEPSLVDIAVRRLESCNI